MEKLWPDNEFLQWMRTENTFPQHFDFLYYNYDDKQIPKSSLNPPPPADAHPPAAPAARPPHRRQITVQELCSSNGGFSGDQQTDWWLRHCMQNPGTALRGKQSLRPSRRKETDVKLFIWRQCHSDWPAALPLHTGGPWYELYENYEIRYNLSVHTLLHTAAATNVMIYTIARNKN